MPNSRFALHGLAPPLIHGLCAFFASNSQFMCLFQGALDTPLDNPFSATLSVHGLHFTVCAPSMIVHSTHRKTRNLAPPTPEIDENDENGGCRPGKMTVCQKHLF